MAAISSILLAGSLGYGIFSQEKQRGEARRAASAAQARQSRLEKEAADEKALEGAAATRDVARAKQKTLASSMGGRGSTILTSPLGIPGDATGTSKTLLGM